MSLFLSRIWTKIYLTLSASSHWRKQIIFLQVSVMHSVLLYITNWWRVIPICRRRLRPARFLHDSGFWLLRRFYRDGRSHFTTRDQVLCIRRHIGISSMICPAFWLASRILYLNKVMVSFTFASLVAVFAPIVTCIQLLPQLYKTVKTKEVKDLSVNTLLLIFASSILWFLHGYFISDSSLFFACSISIIINSILLGYYFQYAPKNLYW